MPLLGNALTTRPRAIIFDIGRVIIGVDTARAFAVLGHPTGLTPAQVWKVLEPTPEWRDWQEGRLSPGEFHAYICKTLGWSIAFDQLCSAWNSMIEPAILLPEALFERLSRSFRLALLSNTDPIHSAHIDANFHFVRYFPVRVYSWRVGVSKPAPAIYQHTLRELDVAPHEALFIDDVYENAAAASELGIAGLHCTTPSEVLDVLARFE